MSANWRRGRACWVVPDLESAVGALCTYEESKHRRDGIDCLYVHTLQAKRLTPKAAITIVVTPSHQITTINVRVDDATKEDP